jgi:hypothetical protein
MVEAVMQRISMRGLVLALVILFATTSAQANDVNNNITASGGTTFFGAIHTDNFDFTDVFTFTVGGSVIASASLVTIGFGLNDIDFLSADLNGVALTLSPTGFLETGSLDATQLTGPLVLTVTGKSGASGGTFASYSGTMNVALVPEASTGLLMGLGLSGLAVAARRSRV